MIHASQAVSTTLKLKGTLTDAQFEPSPDAPNIPVGTAALKFALYASAAAFAGHRIRFRHLRRPGRAAEGVRPLQPPRCGILPRNGRLGDERWAQRPDELG